MNAPAPKTQAILSHHPLFREISPEEVERIAQGTREIHAAKGTILFQKGDPANGFYLVIYGQVKLAFPSPNGSEKVVEIIHPGQSFGEAVMFMEKPYPVYAQALADSLLLHVTKSTVFEEIEHNRTFARKMLAGLSIRLHGLVNDVEAYSLRSCAQRVIGYLLLQNENDSGDGKDIRLTLPAGKAVIASRLNITPETFSRILHDLAEAGLIAVKGKEITILDLEQLRNHGG
ncbi:MAG: Crp/Fnr family transcriptional regulator [Sulfuricellaceae bacterium]|jgi:CRP-like cAMP-binding protein